MKSVPHDAAGAAPDEVGERGAARGDAGASTPPEPLNAKENTASKAPEEASTGPADRELVQRAQDGEQAAFRQLFERYHRRAFAVALGVVKNKQDALDIVQDAFIKVHRHIGSFQGSSSFYTWLYRIIMNLAIDHVRKGRHQKDSEFDERVARDSGDVAGDGTMLPRMLDGNPGKTAVRRELSEKIQAALMELPEYHRAVILMREVEGLSYEEMAKIMKVPKGTIMSRLFHARRKMQEALEGYLDGDLHIED